MGHNDEQHFVPQFYLRNFSADGRRLNLLYLRAIKIIRNASLRQQCARTKFYDFLPGLEKQFGDFEGQSASIIRDIVEADKLPRKFDQLSRLYGFVVLQMLRGVRAADANDYMTDYHAKLMLEGRDEAKGIDLSEIEIANKYPAALPLSILPSILPVAFELRPHLFLNTSSTGFITSDDPVVLHNQYCEGITYQGVTGWASKGLQVFLPLSPRHALMLFDDSVYRVGSEPNKFSTVLNKVEDVQHFNALQILNAVSNVYFRSPEDTAGLKDLAHSLAKERAQRPMTIVETAPIHHADGTSSSLLHTFRSLLRWKLGVTAIRLRPGARKVPLEQRAKDRRNPPDKPHHSEPGGETVMFEASQIIGEHANQYSAPDGKPR